MKYIGAHVASTHDLAVAPYEAQMLGARSFALNLVDPKQWRRPPLTQEEADAFKAACEHCGYEPKYILPHASFLMNLCQSDRRKLNMARQNLIDEMNRCRLLGLTMINFHPGSTLGQISEEEGIGLMSESIDYCLSKTEGVVAVIENTAGQGSNIGYTFAQIAAMIAAVEQKDRVGVCIDTCHAFAAGYDLSTDEGYDGVWAEFDSTIGFDRLRGLHLNDSMRDLGSKIDRHHSIGKGEIGREFFVRLMRDPRFDNIPIILETPRPEIWREEIALLNSFANN